MGISFVVTALILFACIGEMRAAVMLKIQGGKQNQTTEKFKLRISERGTRFDEKVEIDEKNDIEYFKVPPHNELSETDGLYDFRMNITVSRDKKNSVCHISPLPPDLPRPSVLAKGLKMLSNLPPTHKVEKTTQRWTLGDIVDKQTLRPEVRKFCGQFPVYRLKPFSPDSFNVVSGDTHADRKRRDFKFVPCDENNLPSPLVCNPDVWKYDCLISTSKCLFYITCKLDRGARTLLCSKIKHLYTSMVCCQPRCP